MYWQVEYVVNQLVFVVGVALIWRSCNCYAYNSYETILALFKFGGLGKNRQTTKLKLSPNKLRVRYITKALKCKTVLSLKLKLINWKMSTCCYSKGIPW